MDPLRADWRDVQTGVQRLTSDGKDDEAIRLVRDFHKKLCEVRVLDPACGSGNFLYVALEMMKRLEGEIVALLAELGEKQDTLGLTGHTIDPHQLLGIELNPWAAAVAELVLWIGYLQWHFRTYGKAAPSEPVLRDFKNIQCRDAVLTWSERTPRLDEAGRPVTRWDGVTTITHNVTGEEVPDPDARVQVYDYLKPKAADWPEADFIVGNPPFIGNKRMRENLGDGYVEALRKAYSKVPESADLVMYWWEKAALRVRAYNAAKSRGTRRFGLITTNSLRQTFNRRVLEPHLADEKRPLSLLFAIPDHPWVDSLYGAAVRIAMTVAVLGDRNGSLSKVFGEGKEEVGTDGHCVRLQTVDGKILSSLRCGANISSANNLMSNSGIAYQGVIPGGEGFRVPREQATSVFSNYLQPVLIKRYMNGQKLLKGAEPTFVIGFFGFSNESAKDAAPELFQQLLDKVKPYRDAMKRKSRREKWWLYSEQNSTMRPMLIGIDRYIATCRTAKHRLFSFLDSDILPDTKLVAIGVDAPEYLAVLSSRYHLTWALAAGAFLGVGNDPSYNHKECFYKYPLPGLTEGQRTHFRDLGEQLDIHRKRQQKRTFEADADPDVQRPGKGPCVRENRG